MENPLESIHTAATDVAKDYDAAMEYFLSLTTEDGICFDLGDVIPGVNRPLSELQRRVATVFGLVKGLPEKVDFSVIPEGFPSPLLAELSGMRSILDEISHMKDQIETNGGVAAIEKEALIAVHGGTDQPRNDFGKFFNEMWSRSDRLLGNYYQLNQATNGESVANFTGLAAGFDARVEEIQARAEAIRKLGDEAAEEKEKIDTITAQLEGHENEVSRVNKEAANDRKSILEYLGEVTQKQAEIASAHKAAVSLSEQVTSYQGQFDAFQKQLDDREEAIQSGKADLATLIETIQQREKDLVRQEQDIKDLKAKGETMLAVTTNAGLAGAFSKRVEDLDKELATAGGHFTWAIFFLFISVVPLTIHVFPGLSALLSSGEAPATQISTEQFVIGVFARMAFMLPAAWLTLFMGGRHARLFRLREQYAHKFSIAASVDGFKKQAEGYEDAIAAETYIRLAAINPAERMEPRHAAHDDGSKSPLAALLAKAAQSLPFRKSEE